MALTRTAKIASIEEQIAQLEAKKKDLIQAQKAQDRKDRTHRLIERGAILESLIEKPETLTNEQIKAFLEKTIATDFAHRALAGIVAQSAPSQVKTPENGAAQATAMTAKSADIAEKQPAATQAQSAVKTAG